MKYRTRNQSKICQNRSKIVPKSAPGPTWLARPVSDRFLSNFGSNLGPSWGPSWGHVVQKIDFWKFPKACKNENDFQHHSGPSWERFWNDFGDQNRAKIGSRSVSRAIMKQMQRSSKSSAGALFLRIWRIEKRSQIIKKACAQNAPRLTYTQSRQTLAVHAFWFINSTVSESARRKLR